MLRKMPRASLMIGLALAALAAPADAFVSPAARARALAAPRRAALLMKQSEGPQSAKSPWVRLAEPAHRAALLAGALGALIIVSAPDAASAARSGGRMGGRSSGRSSSSYSRWGYARLSYPTL
jgi:hypothetical protein